MTEGNGEVRKLPKGWLLLDLGETIHKFSTNEKKIKQKDYLEKGIIPVIDQGQEFIGGFTNDEDKIVDCELPVVVFGDHTKVVKFINFKFAPGADGVKVIRPVEAFRPKLFTLFLIFLSKKIPDKGYARHFQYLEKEHVPLPPIAEQERIIEKVEELFSELDQGIESLKTAQKQLKVYRQAVLKWAFEGKLTEEWRKQHSSTLKTGEALLAQIKAERENRYQQQLAEWETAVREWEAIGKVGKKPTKPQKPKELPSLTESELADLPKLPNGWCWVRYGSICSEIRNGISQKPDSAHGEKIFRISAVRPFCIDLQDFRYIDNSDHRYEDFLLKNNEILFTRYNGSRRYVGVCAKFNSNERFLYPDKLIRTRLFSCELTIPDYIVYAANVGESREYLDKRIRTTAGQSGVSGEDIKLTPVPICSLKEQEQIVQEIESRLSICDQLEATIIENLQKAEALRQSILKQAFEGKLVPQDPDDEPAEKLLERIKAERQVNGNTGKKSKPSHQQLTLQEL